MPICEWSAADLDQLLDTPGSWRPGPPVSDREAWRRLADKHPVATGALLARAAVERDTPWPALPGRVLLRFAGDGDRSQWQAIHQARHSRLARAALAAAFSGATEWLPEVFDGLILLLEELSWCGPPHWHLAIEPRQAPRHLPRADRVLVDVYAGITADLVAQVFGLLADELEAFAPGLQALLAAELRRRIVDPILTYDDWFWSPGQHNWSVWIAANALSACSVLLTDRTLDRALVQRVLVIVERFMERYADDGACDEGPGYWAHAGGSVFLIGELLAERSAGTIDLIDHPRLAAMCHYIAGIRLTGEHFWALADCSARVIPPVQKIWRMAERSACAELGALARRLQGDAEDVFSGHDLGGWLRYLQWVDPVRPPPAASGRPVQCWWPSVQLAVLRSRPADEQGLGLAVKAGSNDEAHNHLDVGQFCCWFDGEPLVVDPGVGVYTRAHFGPDRYQVWSQGSLAHNAPVIAGQGQTAADGWGYRAPPGQPRPAAREVVWQADDAGASLAMDLTACYPVASAERVQRILRFDRRREAFSIVDRIAGPSGAVEWRLWSPRPPAMVDATTARFGRCVQLRLSGGAIVSSLDRALDERSAQGWGTDHLAGLLIRADAAAQVELRMDFVVIDPDGPLPHQGRSS